MAINYEQIAKDCAAIVAASKIINACGHELYYWHEQFGYCVLCHKKLYESFGRGDLHGVAAKVNRKLNARKWHTAQYLKPTKS